MVNSHLEDPGPAGVYVSYYVHTSSYVISFNFCEKGARTFSASLKIATTNFFFVTTNFLFVTTNFLFVVANKKFVVGIKKFVVAYFARPGGV